MTEPVLEFTGERFTPECVREIWYEHMHRYALAASLCKGKQVLDLASGEGYGAGLIARSGAEVLSLDISFEAMQHAHHRYRHDAVVGDATRLPFCDHSFACVLCFEALEHLHQQGQLLAEIRRVLHPHGFALISSPDRYEYSEKRNYKNPYHTREFSRDEFAGLLSETFPAYRLFGQRLGFFSLIWEGDEPSELRAQTHQASKLEQGLGIAPMYWIAVVAADAAVLPELASCWTFADAEQSVYAHYEHEIRKNMQAGRLLEERDAEIRKLKLRLEQLES